MGGAINYNNNINVPLCERKCSDVIREFCEPNTRRSHVVQYESFVL
jgi:hypothetical protein